MPSNVALAVSYIAQLSLPGFSHQRGGTKRLNDDKTSAAVGRVGLYPRGICSPWAFRGCLGPVTWARFPFSFFDNAISFFPLGLGVGLDTNLDLLEKKTRIRFKKTRLVSITPQKKTRMISNDLNKQYLKSKIYATREVSTT